MYNINITDTNYGQKLTIGFDKSVTATNLELGAYVESKLEQLELGGELCLVNGAASLVIAFTMSKYINNRFAAVAVFDPGLQGYVVTNSKNPKYRLHTLIKEDEL